MTQGEYFHVIMPVGSDAGWRARRAAIEHAASRNGIGVRFPDYLPHAPVFMLSETKQELAGAMFVLADLTLERPSCYYELGLAEALGLRVRLMAECGTAIHQTAERNKVQYYRDLCELEVVVDRTIEEFVPMHVRATS